MATTDKPDRETFAPNRALQVANVGRRVVKSAKFDSRGVCVSWTDTLGVERPRGVVMQ